MIHMSRNCSVKPIFQGFATNADRRLIVAFLLVTLSLGGPLIAAVETTFDPEAEAAYQAGLDSHRAGNIEEAIAHLERAVSIDPDHHNASGFLATELYPKVGRLADSVTILERLIEVSPEMTDFYQMLLDHYVSILNTPKEALHAFAACQGYKTGSEQAIAACKEAIRMHPAFADAHYLLGVNYIYADDEESAKRQFKEMVLLDIEGAPGMLLHIMHEMKPEWITKRYVEEVNKFVPLVIPGLPDELPVEEVRMLEAYYAPEIRYMYELLDEMPDHVFQTDEVYSYYGFDEEWAEEKRVEIGAYRFYELTIESPKGSDPLTPKVNRFERSRSYDAEYSKEGIMIKRGLYDEVVKFYAYQITRSVRGDEFSITAKFEAPERE